MPKKTTNHDPAVEDVFNNGEDYFVESNPSPEEDSIQVLLLHDWPTQATVMTLDTNEVYLYNKAEPVSYKPFRVKKSDLVKKLNSFRDLLRQAACSVDDADVVLYKQGLMGHESVAEVVAALANARVVVFVDQHE